MLKVSSRLFPIGFIISVDAPNFDPHNFYIDGNWERIKGRVIVGVDESQTEFNTTGKTGGSKYLQKHYHKLSNLGDTKLMNSGNSYGTYIGSGTKNTEEAGEGNSGNLQPYYTAYIWKLISYSN